MHRPNHDPLVGQGAPEPLELLVGAVVAAQFHLDGTSQYFGCLGGVDCLFSHCETEVVLDDEPRVVHVETLRVVAQQTLLASDDVLLAEGNVVDAASEYQVWSLTQFYSDDFSQSRIGVNKCVFCKRTIKVCVSCC